MCRVVGACSVSLGDDQEKRKLEMSRCVWGLLVAAWAMLTGDPVLAEVTVGPRVSVVNRGLGQLDAGVGLAASATLQSASWLRLGAYGDALGTGFVAQSPGVIVDAHATSALLFQPVELSVGAGASFMSQRLCGSIWCGRQTGVVPSADVRVKYLLSSDSSGRTFGVVLEGVAHWVPASVVLPGLNGRANMGLEWGFGGGVR